MGVLNRMNQTESLKKFLSLLVFYIGGKGNIAHYTTCMTRLRIKLRDAGLVKKDMDITKSPHYLFLRDGQLQVLLGPGLVSLAMELLNREFLQEEKEEFANI